MANQRRLYCGNPARAGKRKARTMRFGVGAPMNPGLQPFYSSG